MRHILIIGGDARYLEVIKALRQYDTKIYLVGYDTIAFHDDHIVKVPYHTVDFSIIDAIILPVHGTTPDGGVTSAFTVEEFHLSKETIAKTPSHCVIYTGTTNAFLNDATKARTLEVIFARDDVAIYNAIPTAEATLQLAIEHTDETIHGSNVLVLGYGRVGFTVARLFQNLGANVTVAVRKSSAIARIKEMGMRAIAIDDLIHYVANAQICINTVPHCLLHEQILTAMQQQTLIIDLASAPGGTDFAAAKKRGISAIHALGLPGKTAPKTAGKIIARTMIDLMPAMQKRTGS